jgi:peptide deformylase
MPEEPILPIDDPRLKEPSAPVEAFDDTLRALADRMFDIMDRAVGAGLAAIQIGVPLRLIVIDVNDDAGVHRRLALANPEIVYASRETRVGEGGCLSMPGYDIPVERSMRVRVRYRDLFGRERTIDGDGNLAVCLQHEVDHTNGVIFTDRVSALRRGRAQARFAKVRRRVA